MANGRWQMADGKSPRFSLATAFYLTKNVCGITLTTYGQMSAAFRTTGLPLPFSSVFASSGRFTYTVMDLKVAPSAGSGWAGFTFCTWYQKQRCAGRLSHSLLFSGLGQPAPLLLKNRLRTTVWLRS